MVDDFNRHVVHFDVHTTINTAHLVRPLEQLKGSHGLPQVLRTDDDPEAYWWMLEYNEELHDHLGDLAPAEYRPRFAGKSIFEVSA